MMAFLRPRRLLPVLAAGGAVLTITLYFIINYAPDRVPRALLELARRPDLVLYPEAKTCAECHAAIFEAWKKSRHSVAWVSEFYVKDSKDRSKEKCLPCHIPLAVEPGSKPQPRLERRDDGVFCVPCHVKNKTMHGPYHLLAPPHPTERDNDYRSGRFCGSCHEKTFKEWQAAGVEKSCQDCHMPRAPGRLTQKPPLSWLHRAREVADHSFPHGEITEADLKVSARITGETLEVVLENAAIPHAVPTADNGDPRLYLEALYLGADGSELDRYKEILAPQQETALTYHRPVTFRFPLGAETRSVAINIQYKPAWSKDKQPVRSLSISRDAAH